MDTTQQELMLEWLLNYELKLAARFRYYVALVYTKPKNQNGTKIEFEIMFEDNLRDCDQHFELDEHNAILMAHTSLEKAQLAIKRYKKICNGTVDLRYSVSIYPNSPTAESMMKTAGERLEKALGSQYGAVIDSDSE